MPVNLLSDSITVYPCYQEKGELMAFNENTRVKIPAILHLTRFGYEYVSLKNAVWDENTNIFTEIFEKSINRINPSYKKTTPKTKSNNKDYKNDDTFENIAADSATLNKVDPYESFIDTQRIINELKDLLDYEDLGRAFYRRLMSSTGIKLIDFENFENNSFHVCTELPCKIGDDEFRPDITIE